LYGFGYLEQEEHAVIYIGMDVHQMSTTFCLFDPSAPEGGQYRTVTRPTTEEAIRQTLAPLGGQCQVAYEVGTQAQWIAAIVRPLAADVQVANPSRIPWLFRDGRKNDRLDARKLVTLLYLKQLPTVHLPPAEVSAWRALINHRRKLVAQRTQIKNQVRAILRAFGHRSPFKNLWTFRGQVWLASLVFDGARTLMITTLQDELTFFDQKLAAIEKKLDDIAQARPTVALLRTVPGIGPRTAEAIAAFTDRVDRFKDRKPFASYFGMTPTEDSSGGVRRFGHISKRGPSVVRWVLVEAAYVAVRKNAELRKFYERIHRGNKDRKKKAIVAVGRKLLTIVYAMMRDQKPFDAGKVLRSAA
jgi:transposase